jgi:hypothetical protein
MAFFDALEKGGARKTKQRSGSARRIEPPLSDDGQLYQPTRIIERLKPPDQIEQLMCVLQS